MHYKKYMTRFFVLLSTIASTNIFGADMQMTDDEQLRLLAAAHLRETDLHYCVRNYDTEGVAKLLARGIDPNVQDEFGNTALQIAIGQPHHKMVRLLLQKGANPNVVDPRTGKTPLAQAVSDRNTKIVTMLLNADANANVEDLYDQGTVLRDAVRHNDKEIAELLLRSGADPNLRDRYSATPLETAIDKYDKSMIHLLLRWGANPNLVSPNAYVTPLYETARRSIKGNHIETMMLLLEKGANPDQIAPKGRYRPIDEVAVRSEEWYLLRNAMAHNRSDCCRCL